MKNTKMKNVKEKLKSTEKRMTWFGMLKTTKKPAKAKKVVAEISAAKSGSEKGDVAKGGAVKDNVAKGSAAKGKKSLNRKFILMIAAVALVLVNLVIGLVALGISNSQPVAGELEVGEIIEEPEEPEEPVINAEDMVGEPEITDSTTYQVAGNKPRYLSIPSIGLVNIPVTEFGVTANNQMDSPKSTRVVGWYYRSAFPGKPGVTLMNAHGGDLGTGIFKTLPRAKVGDEVIVEMGDGRKFIYVIKQMVYRGLGAEANSYMGTALHDMVDGLPTLTLITCTGTWLPAQQTYDKRLFVRATLK